MNHHVRERAIFVQTTPAMRRRLAQAIEDLIALMDSLDDDPDLEDNGDAEQDVLDQPHDPDPDEPSLGWTPHEAATGDYADTFYVDAEHDDADDEDSDEDADIGDEPHGDDEREDDPAENGEPEDGY